MAFGGEYKWVNPFISGHVEGTLGKKSETAETDETRFDELPEDEQAELWYQYESLIAEKRDLIRTKKEKEEQYLHIPAVKEIVDEQAMIVDQHAKLVKEKDGLIRSMSESEKQAGKKLNYRDNSAIQEIEKKKDILMARYYELVPKLQELINSIKKKKNKKGEDGENEGWEKTDYRKKSVGFKTQKINGQYRTVRTSKPEDREMHEGTAERKTQERLNGIEIELKLLEKMPGFREAYEKKLSKLFILMKCARSVEQYRARQAEIEADIDYIRTSAQRGKAGTPVGAQAKQIQALEQEKKEIEDTIQEADAFLEGYHINRFLKLKDFAASVAKNRIVDIPSVKELVARGLDNLSHQRSFIMEGHQGCGKTEIARHISKLHMVANGVGFDPSAGEDPEALYDRLEPEVFSGSAEASVYDLVGKLKIVGKPSVDPVDLQKRISEVSEAMKKAEMTGVSKEEIAKLLLGKGDVTETIFAYGPLGRAVRDDKPIIIDEINMIPAGVLARMNKVLLTPIGDKIILQENGEQVFTRGPGLAFIGTMNVGKQYVGIEEFNLATKSRWLPVKVDYPSIEESFDLILAQLVRKDRVRLPPSFPPESYEKLVRLAIVTREVQELFSGQTEGQRFMAMASAVSPESSQLENTVISTRDLLTKIIKPWKDSDFKVPLDDLIAGNILSGASADDQKFLTELFIRIGFFADWDEKQFRKFDILNVNQKEIDALQAAKSTTMYSDADARVQDILKKAIEAADPIKRQLLVGNLASQKEA